MIFRTDVRGRYSCCDYSGKWHESVAKFVKSNPNNLQVIWKARPVPPHHADMYGFSAFAVQLNGNLVTSVGGSDWK